MYKCIYTYVCIDIYKYNIFKNYEKCLLFHLKSSIHSQIFNFIQFPDSMGQMKQK